MGLREAVCALGERRPLAPLGNSMDLSFDSPSIMDISITSETEEKTPNVNNVPDYISEIHTYLREMEVKCKPKIGYMRKQPDITNSMRAILVDWLVEVGEEYKLQNETLHLAYLGELSLIDADPYLKYLPSVIAAAAFLLADYTLTGRTWPESLCKVTGYTLEDIKPCLMDLHNTYLKAAQHTQQSIREKYKSTKYHEVSLIDPPETLNLF
ncbi:hypothetical protein WISP_131697 [Willisornis vidua]|uniref:Cyclin-A2 n=1 Tax=Willisornis vidua TaxID=1566151 RepID=A0ABQ9CQJ4_9PASS|nr:hypothetical protein WISP_131697 [Willisornis vidua]